MMAIAVMAANKRRRCRGLWLSVSHLCNLVQTPVATLFLLCTVLLLLSPCLLHLFPYCIFKIYSAFWAIQLQVCNKLTVSVSVSLLSGRHSIDSFICFTESNAAEAVSVRDNSSTDAVAADTQPTASSTDASSAAAARSDGRSMQLVS